ncbi:hypothetical protein GKQ09_002697 [Escherichia coli]|nr:hypothetical protein [Escherichia coli]EIP2899023.1 hypothetical protein [Escherichia coli]ELK2128632.1 hypothetical protein [Escherichia coli]
MTTITKERLLTIKQWRETYGPGSNVVLPAEEAEELARIALAALEAKPVAWTDDEELRDVKQYGFGEIFQCPPDKYADPRRVIPMYQEPPAPAVPDGLVRAVRFYEQVKRENPPAETGAWKDAVDWVLKEACQVVNTGIKGD